MRLDTEEMVVGVDQALRDKTQVDGIQGNYQYKTVYKTFTIQLSSTLEVVVASKINGMTDDFLATLRNAELTSNRFPILMITHSPIDTITSGTGDLSANGMPFHVASIIAKIKEDISVAELSDVDQAILELELERKQGDRFSDKSSLYEYSNLLTVLGRGFVEKSDFETFGLLYDDNLSAIPKDRLKARLQENRNTYEEIDRIVRHGSIEDSLDREYDKSFIEHLIAAKKNGESWSEGYTFDMVMASRDRLVKKRENPLQIENEGIDIYAGSRIEYSFPIDAQAFIRDDGLTKAKQRRKNILIYNPDQQPVVTVCLSSNIPVKQSWVDCPGADYQVSGKETQIHIKLKRDISMMDDILKEGHLSEAHLRLLVDKIYVHEENGKLSLDICLKAPFRDHMDIYENGEQTECYLSQSYDFKRFGHIIMKDFWENG